MMLLLLLLLPLLLLLLTYVVLSRRLFAPGQWQYPDVGETLSILQ